jgi:uncharacterized membrane protein YphA (DoxX/SURF4 family)
MLSLFPQILFLAPIGTALIRVAAGLAIIYTGWMLYSSREAIARERLPLIGTCPEWFTVIGSFIYIVIGALIAVGLYTQVAALLGALIALKSAIFAKRYATIIPLPRSASLLLLAIMLCLVVSGAGAFAFDLPL